MSQKRMQPINCPIFLTENSIKVKAIKLTGEHLSLRFVLTLRQREGRLVLRLSNSEHQLIYHKRLPMGTDTVPLCLVYS